MIEEYVKQANKAEDLDDQEYYMKKDFMDQDLSKTILMTSIIPFFFLIPSLYLYFGLKDFVLDSFSKMPTLFSSFRYEMEEIGTNTGYSNFYEALRFSNISTLQDSFIDKIAFFNNGVFVLNLFLFLSLFFISSLVYKTFHKHDISNEKGEFFFLIIAGLTFLTFCFTLFSFVGVDYNYLFSYTANGSFTYKFILLATLVCYFIGAVFYYLKSHKRKCITKKDIETITDKKEKEEKKRNSLFEKISKNPLILKEIVEKIERKEYNNEVVEHIDQIFDSIEKEQESHKKRISRYKEIVSIKNAEHKNEHNTIKND